MIPGVTAARVAFALALSGAGAAGWVGLQHPAAIRSGLRAPAPLAAAARAPEAWIQDFDRRRKRLIDRLDGRMERLRRRLDRHQGAAALLARRG